MPVTHVMKWHVLAADFSGSTNKPGRVRDDKPRDHFTDRIVCYYPGQTAERERYLQSPAPACGGGTMERRIVARSTPVSHSRARGEGAVLSCPAQIPVGVRLRGCPGVEPLDISSKGCPENCWSPSYLWPRGCFSALMVFDSTAGQIALHGGPAIRSAIRNHVGDACPSNHIMRGAGQRAIRACR